MKRAFLMTAFTAAAVLSAAGASFGQSAVQTLRGGGVEDEVGVNDVFHQDERRFTRNYRQQPPLIPHTIDQYQIDLRANRCLSCHDWTQAGAKGAPTLSMTHYLDRAGNQLDAVAGTRWFCNQCHVPQVDAPELVDNTFSSTSN